ncbi:MAG: potassium channel protein [Actinobacteria bacterium RBG_16_64_13]|nr:MAG: potassium channel protein [Actinobacteria bacterium RBG_16_64_13]
MRETRRTTIDSGGRSTYESVKKRVHDILVITYPHDQAARAFGFFIITLIVLNVMAVILQTVKSLNDSYEAVFYYFEMASVIIFSVEYLFRSWSCTVDEKYSHPLWGRLRYAVTPLALIDLIAIAPFYPLAFLGVKTVDTTFVRALRLFRLMRLFKTTRYFQSFQILARVLRAKKEQILVAALVVVILLVLLSSLMYFIERSAQPEKFSSIPAAMWWGVSTMTTVGYGDVYPVTVTGKVVGAIISLLGIALFAMPAGMLASGFAEELQARRGQQRRRCPHCGRELE